MSTLPNMTHDYSKAPRLYVPDDLREGAVINLSSDHAHYLMHVMRKVTGDAVRIFNGRNGEFVAVLSPKSKKTTELIDLKRSKNQKNAAIKIHLYFAPIKKDRLAMMIEKSVELGITDFHPIITDRTENRKYNEDKVMRYIIEAAEQCERMDMPTLHKGVSLHQCQFINPTFAAIERRNDIAAFKPQQNNQDIGLAIGPEGGWTADEIQLLITHKNVTPVHLGDLILRAETAAFFMISQIDKSTSMPTQP